MIYTDGYHEAHQDEGLTLATDCPNCMIQCDYCHKYAKRADCIYYDTAEHGITALCDYCESMFGGGVSYETV